MDPKRILLLYSFCQLLQVTHLTEEITLFLLTYLECPLTVIRCSARDSIPNDTKDSQDLLLGRARDARCELN